MVKPLGNLYFNACSGALKKIGFDFLLERVHLPPPSHGRSSSKVKGEGRGSESNSAFFFFFFNEGKLILC